MGSHAGILTFGDAPVPAELAGHVERSLTRGRGPTRSHTSSSIALYSRCLGGHHGSTEGGPPAAGSSGVVVAFDGRLDERDTLAAQLGLSGESLTDTGLVIAAYERWSATCLQRFFGEWSVAIYDAARRQLILASDFSGAFPVYYSVTPEYAMWSSELATFASCVHGERIDTKYLLGFILDLPELGHTPYEGVKAVVPGCMVAVANGQITSSVAWMPDLTARVCYKTDREYEDHFRDVFWRVVRDRLSTPGPIWAELSGGLDTSSIVCVADEIVRAAGGGAEKLCTVFYRFHGGNSDEDCNAAQEIIRKTNVRAVVVDSRDLPYLSDAPSPVALPSCVGGVVPEVAKLMPDAGTRVLLSGEGGDGLMCDGRGWPCPLLIESLKEGRLSRSFREAIAFGQWTGRSVWDLFWNDVLNSRRWKQPALFAATPPSWVRARDAMRYRDWVRSYRSYPPLSECTVSAALAYQYVDAARRCIAAQPDRLTGAIDVSYPYLDRRLVQFMLAVPFHQKLQPGTGRWLQRRALEGVLPDRVRWRKRKSSGRGPLIRALDAEWSRIDRLLSADSRLAQLGLIDRDALRLAASGAKAGRTANLGAIWKSLAVEQWLRASDALPIA